MNNTQSSEKCSDYVQHLRARQVRTGTILTGSSKRPLLDPRELARLERPGAAVIHTADWQETRDAGGRVVDRKYIG